MQVVHGLSQGMMRVRVSYLRRVCSFAAVVSCPHATMKAEMSSLALLLAALQPMGPDYPNESWMRVLLVQCMNTLHIAYQPKHGTLDSSDPAMKQQLQGCVSAFCC